MSTEINQEKLLENIQNQIKKMIKEVKIASIPMDSIAKPSSDDFEIKKNFPCLKCQQFPVGSVQ